MHDFIKVNAVIDKTAVTGFAFCVWVVSKWWVVKLAQLLDRNNNKKNLE